MIRIEVPNWKGVRHKLVEATVASVGLGAMTASMGSLVLMLRVSYGWGGDVLIAALLSIASLVLIAGVFTGNSKASVFSGLCLVSTIAGSLDQNFIVHFSVIVCVLLWGFLLFISFSGDHHLMYEAGRMSAIDDIQQGSDPLSGLDDVTSGRLVALWVRSDVRDKNSAWIIAKNYGIEQPTKGFVMKLFESYRTAQKEKMSPSKPPKNAAQRRQRSQQAGSARRFV